VAVSAYDVLLQSEAGTRMLEHAARHGVLLCASHAALAARSDLLISAVTANQTVPVAQDIAPHMRRGARFLDLNSAAPSSKVRAAGLIDAAGAAYVEAAVMSSILPQRLSVPLLLGGTHAARLLPMLIKLGFDAKLASNELGVASAIKMCRSVMIKGLEAMVVESFTAARAYGVEDAVLASLKQSFPGIDWEQQGAYFFQRVIEHGRRRSEEMLEVAETVRGIGLPPCSALGTAERQAFIADLADAGLFGVRGSAQFARSADWRVEADRLIASVLPNR